MLYADVEGNIGQVAAVKLPTRSNDLPADVLVSPAQSDVAWEKMTDVSSLPVTVNPADGFLLSANNRPAAADAPLGYFFSPDDRMIRMREILTEKSRVDIGDIKALQRDVYMTYSVELRDALMPLLLRLNVADAGQQEIVALMAGWDGHYRTDSRGALAYELFYSAFKKRFAVSLVGEQDADTYAGIGRIKSLLIADLERTDAETVAASLRPALAGASKAIASFANWGEMHRLAISHPMGFLPVIGSRYRFADYPVGGSSHSIMKTAHSTTDERHNTRFESNARHISDLSDMDRNYFVLLGGQDGWFKSANFLDQVPYWLSGDYVQLPMRLDVVRKSFTRKTVLGASEPGSGN
jgi:penicillin amidase